MAFNLSGNCGVAGATVSWSGTSSGSVTADGSGNYSASGVLTSGGNYTITPSKAFYQFSPSSSFWPNVTQNLGGINFTGAPIPKAKIVQKAVQMNTTGGDTATATFANNLTAGNGLIVAVMAVDTGGSIGNLSPSVADMHGSGAAAYASVTDTQGNNLTAQGNSPNIYGDQTNNKTFFVGIYFLNLFSGGLEGASDAVTFTFTPISSAGNCVVGIVAYEVEGFGDGVNFFGTPGDTAATAKAGENSLPGAYPGVFPPSVVGDITTTGLPNGSFDIVCAAATTTDGSTFSVGSETGFDPYGQGPVGELGWSLDASQAAFINGTHVTLAVQSEFLTGMAVDNPCTFGSTPSGTVGIASVAAAAGFGIANVPFQGPSITTASLPNGTIGVAYNQTLAEANGQSPFTWSIASGSLPNGLSLNSSTGVISGTPTVGGNFSFSVQIADSSDPALTATKSFTLDVVAAPSTGPAAGGWASYQNVVQPQRQPAPPRPWYNPKR